MNEKIPGYIAVGVISLVTAWTVRASPRPEQMSVVALILLVASVTYGHFVQRRARKAIIDRRRLYKELWSRGDEHSVPDLTKPEEDSVVLLGRIRGVRFTH